MKTGVAEHFPRINSALERAGIPEGRHEHPVDGLAAIVACKNSDVMRAALAHLRAR